MKTVSVKVPDALDSKLAAAVKRRRAGKSALVRATLEQYLDEARGPRAGSVFDLAERLAGCVKTAPRDLSTDPRHLKNLGK